MEYKNPDIAEAATRLKQKLASSKNKRSILKSPELTALFDQLKLLPPGKPRADFGAEVNRLKAELDKLAHEGTTVAYDLTPIDVTAPFDINSPCPKLLPFEQGSKHPLTAEIEKIIDIFERMGFAAVESKEIDSDYYMFTSLNFPPDHPARSELDTFVTEDGLFAPAHTSNMQNRVLKAGKTDLEAGQPIAAIIPDRVFRNEDLDARHEHTFYQLEGVYVDKGINAGHLIATLQTFLEAYYGKTLRFKFQPFYFPFTEPSFEIVLSCPFCESRGCHICSQSGWIELLGCGMIHPNVLREAGIDSSVYTGFAWGCGIDRLAMMKYGIEDVRHFHAGNLKFLRQF